MDLGTEVVYSKTHSPLLQHNAQSEVTHKNLGNHHTEKLQYQFHRRKNVAYTHQLLPAV